MSSIQNLRALNLRLSTRLGRLPGGHIRPAVIAPTELTDLLRELAGTGDCLHHLAASPDAETSSEISQVRTHLQQLMKILPSLHSRLLVEKARLETTRTNLVRAAAWAESSQKTL